MTAAAARPLPARPPPGPCEDGDADGEQGEREDVVRVGPADGEHGPRRRQQHPADGEAGEPSPARRRSDQPQQGPAHDAEAGRREHLDEAEGVLAGDRAGTPHGEQAQRADLELGVPREDVETLAREPGGAVAEPVPGDAAR